MTPNEQQAAYLAYFAYIDADLDAPTADDFRSMLKKISSDYNGPWTLTWGPVSNNGIVSYVAQGQDGTFGLAFRGTDTNIVDGVFQNFLSDTDVFYPVTWMYPQSINAQISAGTNQALALAMMSTDPTLDVTLFDYINTAYNGGGDPINLIVTGHSLGGGIAVAASLMLHNQLSNSQYYNIYPFTFAAPTVTDLNFKTAFTSAFANYAPAVNTNDIVPMLWNNLSSVLTSFAWQSGSQTYPTLWGYSETLYGAIYLVQDAFTEYVTIAQDNEDSFSQNLVPNVDWPSEVEAMHSMQNVYFYHALGFDGPNLPHATSSAVTSVNTVRSPFGAKKSRLHGRRPKVPITAT